MNQSYMYANGNIHVLTNKDKKVIDYNDNFKEQLKIENNIEKIETLIERNNTRIEELEKILEYNFYNYGIKLNTNFIIGYGIPAFIDLFSKIKIENIGKTSFCLSLLFVLFRVTKDNELINKYKSYLLEYKARVKCKDKFEKKYIEEKTKYEKLIKNKKENEQDYIKNKLKLINIYDKNQMEYLNEYFSVLIFFEAYKKDIIKEYKKTKSYYQKSFNKIELDILKQEIIKEMEKKDAKGKQKRKLNCNIRS